MTVVKTSGMMIEIEIKLEKADNGKMLKLKMKFDDLISSRQNANIHNDYHKNDGELADDARAIIIAKS